MDNHADNGIYIFTVLHSGQAGFIVVIPSTISRAPLVRKVSGDVISAINQSHPPCQRTQKRQRSYAVSFLSKAHAFRFSNIFNGFRKPFADALLKMSRLKLRQVIVKHYMMRRPVHQ